MTIAENIETVREKMAEAALKCGRSVDGITLTAATKMNSAESVRQAISAGITVCGENRAQELLEKNAQGAYAGAQLHFIGTLQTNKVRQLVGLCDLIQSVDSPELISLIGKKAMQRNMRQDILLEVNVAGEQAKSGAAPGRINELLDCAAQTGGVRVLGLMTIPPIQEKAGGNSQFFDTMYNLFVDIRAKKYDNVSMRILSMGMSGDYIEAIMSGSTMIRVGSAIFGPRS